MLKSLSNIWSSFTPKAVIGKDFPYNVENKDPCFIYPWAVARGLRRVRAFQFVNVILEPFFISRS